MGERIQYVASILFALAFVALLSIMNSNVLQYGAAVNSRVNNNIELSETYELQSFDSTTVTGDTVISAIRNSDTLSNQKLTIEVRTSDGRTTSYGEGGTFPSYSVTAGQPYYIGPSQKFTSALIRNANEIVTKVLFEYST